MDFEILRNVRAVAMESPDESIEELVMSKKVTVSKNNAGRKAFMNNAPVDNFGTKEYQYVLRLAPNPSYEKLKS
jgi:hypothetical protein